MGEKFLTIRVNMTFIVLVEFQIECTTILTWETRVKFQGSQQSWTSHLVLYRGKNTVTLPSPFSHITFITNLLQHPSFFNIHKPLYYNKHFLIIKQTHNKNHRGKSPETPTKPHVVREREIVEGVNGFTVVEIKRCGFLNRKWRVVFQQAPSAILQRKPTNLGAAQVETWVVLQQWQSGGTKWFKGEEDKGRGSGNNNILFVDLKQTVFAFCLPWKLVNNRWSSKLRTLWLLTGSTRFDPRTCAIV